MSDQGQSVEQLQAEIEAARSRLSRTIVELTYRAQPQQIVARLQSRHPLTRRDTVRLQPDYDKMHVFSNKTGDRLS